MGLWYEVLCCLALNTLLPFTYSYRCQRYQYLYCLYFIPHFLDILKNSSQLKYLLIVTLILKLC